MNHIVVSVVGYVISIPYLYINKFYTFQTIKHHCTLPICVHDVSVLYRFQEWTIWNIMIKKQALYNLRFIPFRCVCVCLGCCKCVCLCTRFIEAAAVSFISSKIDQNYIFHIGDYTIFCQHHPFDLRLSHMFDHWNLIFRKQHQIP